MIEIPPFEPVGIDASPIVYYVPSIWDHSQTTEGGDEVFTYKGFFVEVATLLLESDDPADVDADPRTLLAGAKDEDVIERGPAVLLVSGLAMISYTEAGGEGAQFHHELCGFYAPGRLAVLRYTMVQDDVGGNMEAGYWMHVFRQLARMTYFS